MTVATMPRGASAIPQTGREARLMIRRGDLTGPTAGLAPGYVQGNLAILPAALAGDFLRFCQLNPKPCPLLAASAPAIGGCRRSPRTSISAPICRATGYSGAAR